jgi:hypothetical protein
LRVCRERRRGGKFCECKGLPVFLWMIQGRFEPEGEEEEEEEEERKKRLSTFWTRNLTGKETGKGKGKIRKQNLCSRANNTAICAYCACTSMHASDVFQAWTKLLDAYIKKLFLTADLLEE